MRRLPSIAARSRPAAGVRRGLLLLLAASAAAVAATVAPPPRETSLAIGPTWAVVRDEVDVTFAREQEEVEFAIPVEADLSTLSITDARGSVRLLSWRRLPAATPSTAPLAAWGDEQGYHLSRSEAAPPGGRVRCLLETAQVRSRPLDVVYGVTGVSWRAHYEISIRGDVANYLEPMSLDLAGRVTLSNGTTRAFAPAHVLLVGEDPRAPDRVQRSARDPGILMLDDESPLADIWRGRPQAPPVPYQYPLSEPVNLPALSEVSVPVVNAQRTPAERLYVMNADEFDVDAPGPWRPLTRLLTFRNDPAAGMGQALPPGPVLIYLGGVRGALYQQARLRHTAANGEIRIDLGRTEGVTGVRRSQGRETSSAGFREQTVEIQVANALPSPVRVEVVERPPVPLAWAVTRSSKPYELLARRLRYSVEVEGRSEQTISYTVRLTEPEM